MAVRYPDYFNTTAVAGRELATYVAQASSQNEKVREFMEHNPGLVVTSEYITSVVLPRAPATSARRALTVLEKNGVLEQVDQVRGKYGRPIFTYRLKQLDPEQSDLFT